jgi:hypothetical protein
MIRQHFPQIPGETWRCKLAFQTATSLAEYRPDASPPIFSEF